MECNKCKNYDPGPDTIADLLRRLPDYPQEFYIEIEHGPVGQHRLVGKSTPGEGWITKVTLFEGD